MRCYHSISKIMLYGALVFIGAKCAQLPCHSCDDLLTNETDPTPRCINQTIINCDDTKFFCGIVVHHLNNTGTLVYKEMCVHHFLCINTTAACSPDCFLHCCHEQLCNSYDKAKKKLNYNLASIIKKHTKTELPVIEQPTLKTEPSNVKSVTHTGTRKRNIRKTTPSSASLLMSCKILLVLLFVVILKDI